MNKIYLLLALISLSAHAEHKVINISTSIDVNNLYANSINSLVFEPSRLELEVSADKTRFKTTSSTLKVETSIPKEVNNIAYVAGLIRNDTTCKDYSGFESSQPDFVSVSIDSQPLEVGESLTFADFQFDDGFNKYSEHEVKLEFASFSSITTTSQPEGCNGEIEFNIEVEI
ncbi:hypothetical protein F0231_09495 [Vibrio sp. RE86]|uniref:hypothetical protein n=1 Tax=Vibrio sp. RE86 TaxID=2607605 RepID=UPI0014939302|nr:hypothetical protein [Vibrio sp. RE86]NOH79974.1 hypothetical protein [Vibrio sp. RE86]